MSHRIDIGCHQTASCDELDRVLALGFASAAASTDLDDHLAHCAGCRAALDASRLLQRPLDAARRVSAGEARAERLWAGQLADEASAAAERMARRAAWQTILGDRRLKLASATLALAAGLALVIWLGPRRESSPPTMTTHSSPAASSSPKSAPPASAAPTKDKHREDRARERTRPAPAVRAPSTRADERQLRLACGARVSLGDARVSVLRNKPGSGLLRLHGGRVTVDVPRLPRDGRLEVLTEAARVQVKGTRFIVSRITAKSTTVEVEQGTVWVTPTGRARRTLVLKAGDRRTVLGETAYLARLLARLDRSILRRGFREAIDLGDRYLAVAPAATTRLASIRLRQAGAHAQLGEHAEAERLYREVAAHHLVGPTARQNAIARLARLLQRRGDRAAAAVSWQRLVSDYPDHGIHGREARRWLVRLTCREQTSAARRYRRELARCCATERAAARLLRACRALAGERAP